MTFVEVAKKACQTSHVSWCEVSIAYWRNNQIPNQRIGLVYCLLDAAWISAGSNIQLSGNQLMRQQH
jgi:hypothetical protein